MWQVTDRVSAAGEPGTRHVEDSGGGGRARGGGRLRPAPQPSPFVAALPAFTAHLCPAICPVTLCHPRPPVRSTAESHKKGGLPSRPWAGATMSRHGGGGCHRGPALRPEGGHPASSELQPRGCPEAVLGRDRAFWGSHPRSAEETPMRPEDGLHRLALA